MSDAAALGCRLVTDEAGFDALAADWEALEAADPEATPFNAFDWNRTWWARYGVPGTLRIVVLEAGGRTVGIAPFHLGTGIECRVLRVPTLRFVGAGGDTSPDYLGVLADPDRREAIVERALDEVLAMPGWRTLSLRDLRAGSVLDVRAARRFESARGAARPVHAKRVLVADLPESWEAFRRSLSTKRRKQLNHRANRLAAAGEVQLSLAENAADRERAFEALVRLHRERWVSKGEPGGFRSDAYTGFHREVIERFAARDRLWLVTLELDGVIIGVMYLFLWRDELMFFQSGFDPAHEALSPGHVMFGWTFRRAIERGLRRADMLKGEYAYKRAWARRETFLHDHTFHRPGPTAFAEAALGPLHRRLRARLGRRGAGSADLPDPSPTAERP